MMGDPATRLDQQDHRLLAIWAADCAERVLRYFEEWRPHDDRPRQALEAARAWARGELAMSEARQAAFAAHAAARAVDDVAARAAARSTGHAAATAHVAAHARHAAAYAAKAVAAAAVPADVEAAVAAEHRWQVQRLPELLRPIAFPSSQE